MKKIKYIYIAPIIAFGLMVSSCLKEDPNPSSGTPNPIVTLPVIQDVYKDKKIKLSKENLSGATHTGGIVISDATTGNIASGFVTIQTSSRGQVRGINLLLNDDKARSLQIGDSVSISLENAFIDRIDGSLSITELGDVDVIKIEEDVQTIIRTVTISRLKSHFKEYENTLVLITGDLTNEPSPGETLSGSKSISDGGDDVLIVFTDENASFAGVRIAPSATFRGIAVQKNGTIQLRLRSAADLIDPSGPIYPSYPEDFEFPDGSEKPSYNMPQIENKIALKTGVWKLQQAVLGNIANRDRVVSGIQSVRMQQNLRVAAYLEMDYDLPEGASKVTFWYGSYFNDQSCSFQLEFSLDGGQNWEIIGEPISDAHMFSASAAAKQASFLVDFQEPVRFRIHKQGLGPSNGSTVRNGRLGIDDFAVYQGY